MKQSVESKKVAYYEADCKALQSDYEAAKSALGRRVKPSKSFDPGVFVEAYSGYYDPSQMVPLAKAMNDFYYVVDATSVSYGPYYTATNNITGRYNTDISRLSDAQACCSRIEKYGLAPDWVKSYLKEARESLDKHYEFCQEAIKMVDKIGIKNVPNPVRRQWRNNDLSLEFNTNNGPFSFYVTDFSDGDGYVFFVVHAMKGGKLPGFIDGYSSLDEAITAGYAAGLYGFRRTVGRSYRGLLTALIDKQRHKVDIERARQDDLVMDIVSSWFE